MSEAEELNRILERDLPAAWRCLSPLGRDAAFPRGIVYQAGEARQANINATIGQVTDGRGTPLPLPAIGHGLDFLDDKTAFLYSPIAGPASLREAWRAREVRLASAQHIPTTLPVVGHGLTHGLSLVAALFADAETDVVLTSPAWDNYDLIFSLHARARPVRYPFFRDGRFNVEGLADALARVRSVAIVVLNFPGNPTGYQPTTAEVQEIVAVLAAHPGPTVVVTDDAYQGYVYAEDRHPRSVFWDVCQAADLDRLLPVKVDGATKELVFFSSRVAFLHQPASTEAAEAAMENKLKFLLRGTVGAASGPALALVDRALRDGALEAQFSAVRDLLGLRWKTLGDGLATLPASMVPYPFHGAFFALLQLSEGLCAEELRVRLLCEHSVGVIAFPEVNALRVAFCSLHNDDLPPLLDALRAVAG